MEGRGGRTGFLSLMRLGGVFKKTRQIEHKQMLVQWGKFADGFPNLFINDVKEMAGKDGNRLAWKYRRGRMARGTA